MRRSTLSIMVMAALTASTFVPRSDAWRELLAASGCKHAKTYTWDYVQTSGGATLTYQPDTHDFLLTLTDAQNTVFFRDNSDQWHGAVVPSRLTTTQLVKNLEHCGYFGTAVLQVDTSSTGDNSTCTASEDAAVIGTLLKFKVSGINANPCRGEVSYTVWPNDLDPKDPQTKKRLKTAVAENATSTTFNRSVILTLNAPRNVTGRLGPEQVDHRDRPCLLDGAESDYCDISLGGGMSYAAGLLENIEGAATHAALSALGYVGDLIGIFWPTSGPGSQSVNGLDVWNCISKYVKHYVEGVISQARLQDIQDDMTGLMALIRDYSNAGSQEERRPKYTTVLAAMIGTLDPRFSDPKYGLPQQVLPYMVQFGTWYTAWRQQEVVNYTAIYNNVDANPQSHFQSLVDSITKYQLLVETAFNESLAWRSNPSEQGIDIEYWTGYDRGCGIGCHCYEIKGYDHMTGWSSDHTFRDCCHQNCNYKPMQSDIERLLGGEKTNAMAQWYITMRLTIGAAVYWPLLVPHKKLTVGYDQKRYETEPFGNCGSKNWQANCAYDGNSLIRLNPPAKQEMTGITVYGCGDVSGVEVFFSDGTSAKMGAIRCESQHLSLGPNEGINGYRMWCHYESSYGPAMCTSIAGLQLHTNRGNDIKMGNQNGDPSYQVNFQQFGKDGGSAADAKKQVWACGVSGRLSVSYNPQPLTALGFDWCWNEPKLQCTSSNPNECDWTKYVATLPAAASQP